MAEMQDKEQYVFDLKVAVPGSSASKAAVIAWLARSSDVKHRLSLMRAYRDLG